MVTWPKHTTDTPRFSSPTSVSTNIRGPDSGILTTPSWTGTSDFLRLSKEHLGVGTPKKLPPFCMEKMEKIKLKHSPYTENLLEIDQFHISPFLYLVLPPLTLPHFFRPGNCTDSIVIEILHPATGGIRWFQCYRNPSRCKLHGSWINILNKWLQGTKFLGLSREKNT